MQTRFLGDPDRVVRRPLTHVLRTVPTRSGRALRTTVAYDSYWHLAAERQAMLFRKLRGDQFLTSDRVLREHRFTNAYRVADRVSQFVLTDVQARAHAEPSDVFFRTVLFKIFNRIDTWRELERRLGERLHAEHFDADLYRRHLGEMAASGSTVYSAAYIMPNPAFDRASKSANHVELVAWMIREDYGRRAFDTESLSALYELMMKAPSLGPFTAMQYAIDVNYSDLSHHDESEFVVAGPGAVSGIRKCFEDTAGYTDSDVVQIVQEHQATAFDRLAIRFPSLYGRPLQLIDVQNLFCETDKYARVVHPELAGTGDRTRIKQRYRPSPRPLAPLRFPERWKARMHTTPPDVPRIVPG